MADQRRFPEPNRPHAGSEALNLCQPRDQGRKLTIRDEMDNLLLVLLCKRRTGDYLCTMPSHSTCQIILYGCTLSHCALPNIFFFFFL